MRTLRKLLATSLLSASFLLPATGEAADMCYDARVYVGTWNEGTRWCSPFSPYSVHCVGPWASNSSTGQTITVTTEACYPTRLW